MARNKRHRGRVTKDQKELIEALASVQKAAIESNYENNKEALKEMFNLQYGENPNVDIVGIIPSLSSRTLPEFKKGARVSGDDKIYAKITNLLNTKRMQSGGIPVSELGQFQYPGKTVAVPTMDGTITMDGVDQRILAIDGGGNAQILQPNSGITQFEPGVVLEFPLGEVKKKRRKRKKKGLGQKFDNLPKPSSNNANKTSFVSKTLENFNDRNEKTMFQNKNYNKGLPRVRR